MNNLSQIGLNVDQSHQLAQKLNLLLADLHVFYMNTRGFHWNIRGDKFFELHLKFEELYTDLQIKIDEVAERILTLGYTPLHSFTDFLKVTDVKEVKDLSDGKDCIRSILEAFRTILIKERELLELSAQAADEGTNALMSDYIREQEKLVWMYTAYLKN
ncbi:MAG: starvation-inducible DNA-binding protein [Bacteroidales bacterium]|jgi:starvation-inducible DNA-binding protein|nr:starvation-inducible DNA-binding protein [Bacteroidales bacterium]MDN5329643.1 starvation-inducible DNA-binding protein [Bacteroidales bacterium]